MDDQARDYTNRDRPQHDQSYFMDYGLIFHI